SPNNCNACLLLILHILGLYYIYRRTSPSSYLSSPSYIVRIGRSLASSLAASMAGGGFDQQARQHRRHDAGGAAAEPLPHEAVLPEVRGQGQQADEEAAAAGGAARRRRRRS